MISFVFTTFIQYGYLSFNIWVWYITNDISYNVLDFDYKFIILFVFEKN